MSRLVLDTSAYIELRADVPAVVRRVADADWIGMPAATIGELRVGHLLARSGAEHEDLLLEFLAEPRVHVVSIDDSVASEYARIFVALRRAGTPIAQNDIWIAACATQHGAAVLTFDREFDYIAGVEAVVLERR